MRKIIRVLREERGAETLEWILIGGIIIAVGILVYGPNSTLKEGLEKAVATVTGKIETASK